MAFIPSTRTHGRPTTDHSNGTPAAAVAIRPWLTRLFAGDLTLPPIAPVGLAVAERSPAETDALVRALACPDLFVFDVPDRMVRERGLHDLLRLAGARGERVLLLSPDPAAADRLAEAAAADRSLPVVRALADDENPNRPLPAATRLTSNAVGTGRVEQMKREAALAVAALEARRSRLERTAGQRLRLAQIEIESSALADQVQALEAAVRAEAEGHPHPTALTEAIAQLRADRGAATAAFVDPTAAIAARLADREHHDGHGEVVSELAAARDRLGELTTTGLEIARRFLAEARIVIGTPGSVAADPVFAAAGPASPPFGLLVLDRAEELTERDFARLSRLAGRWVLAGDAACPDEAPPAAIGSRGPDRLPEPTFVARLAPLLDREPMTIEGDRLVFRLLHLSREQRRAAAREPVLDHPHVELRMTAGDDGDPVLAEIAFPADTPIAAAKAFLFSQLG